MQNKRFILFLLPLMLVACGKHSTAKHEATALRVTTVYAQGAATSTQHKYVGAIEEQQRLPLALQTGGRITEVLVREGQSVRAGDVLLRVDSAQAHSALQSARALLSQAEDAMARVREVHLSGGVTDQQMVDIRTKLEQAKSVYDMALRHLDDCSLLAPCDGVATDIRAIVGQVVAPGVPVLDVVQRDQFFVRFAVPEAEISRIAIGQRGGAEIGALDGQQLAIRVTEKQMEANPITHTYAVRAQVERRPELMAGMACTVLMDCASTTDLTLPAHCIQMLPAGPTVWVVDSDSLVSRRPIEIGQYVQGGVVVRSGLQPTDRVVSEGYQKLYNGAKVVY